MSERNADDSYLLEQGVLGVLAEDWWKSELGKYIIRRSLQETQEIIAKMKAVDAYDTNKIMQLQMEWKACEQALIWMDQAIRAGKSAVAILENQQDSKESI
jgi:hypothetical protein